MPNALRWSDAEIEFAKKLWTQGKSASDISRALAWEDYGAERSRNAVIGMIHRAGLQKRTCTTYNTIGSARARKRKRLTSAQKVLFSPRINHNPEWQPARPKQLPAELAEAAALPPLVKWADLNPEHCKYPSGDPQEAGFAYCGRERIACGPYCAAHTRLCYTPAKPRTSVKSLFKLQRFADRNLVRAA